jgi:hypothetical protein
MGSATVLTLMSVFPHLLTTAIANRPKQKEKTKPCLLSCLCCRNSPAIVVPFPARMLLLLLLLLDYATLGLLSKLSSFPSSMVRSVGRWARLCMAYALGSLSPSLSPSPLLLRLALFSCIWIVLIKPPPPTFCAFRCSQGRVPSFALARGRRPCRVRLFCVCRYLMIIPPTPLTIIHSIKLYIHPSYRHIHTYNNVQKLPPLLKLTKQTALSWNMYRYQKIGFLPRRSSLFLSPSLL